MKGEGGSRVCYDTARLLLNVDQTRLMLNAGDIKWHAEHATGVQLALGAVARHAQLGGVDRRVPLMWQGPRRPPRRHERRRRRRLARQPLAEKRLPVPGQRGEAEKDSGRLQGHAPLKAAEAPPRSRAVQGRLRLAGFAAPQLKQRQRQRARAALDAGLY